MDVFQTVKTEIYKRYQEGKCVALPDIESSDHKSCGFLTKDTGRILKVLTYPGLSFATVIVLSSTEGIHPNAQEDKPRLVEFMAEVNDWLNYGSLVFIRDQEEISYKTAQIFTDENTIRPTISFMLEQQERYFSTISNCLKVLFEDLSKSPSQIAGDLKRALIQD